MTTQQLLPARLALTTGALVLALASTVCISTTANADVLAHYEPKILARAERALDRGKPDHALRLLHSQRAILGHDKYAARRASLVCSAHFSKKQFEEAESACDTAVEKGNHGDMWVYLNNRGAVRLALGQYSEALTDFRKASQLNPASREARQNMQLAKRAQREQGPVPGLDRVSML